MTHLGVTYLLSAAYLSFIVALVISINENDTLAKIGRETMRRGSKLIGVLLIAGLIVQVLTLFSGS